MLQENNKMMNDPFLFSALFSVVPPKKQVTLSKDPVVRATHTVHGVCNFTKSIISQW